MRPVTYAEIDLNAVQHNLAQVRQFAPQAKVMAVIKANAYGHGLLQIATALKEADALAIARVDEAIRLRQAGFKQQLAVLEGFNTQEELEAFVFHDLEAIVHCPEQILLLENSLERSKINVWLKLDTGMNRLGFKSAEFSKAYQALKQCPQVENIYFMTHLASADNKNDSKTLEQISLFRQTVQTSQEQCSIANSAGILAWKESLSDWVRSGIMLYGISPFAETTGKNHGLKPVMSLYSQLIAIKEVQKGETVGYSGTWLANKKTRLGVIAIGYGDGYPRHAMTGTPILINDVRVLLVGRVSMDMLTVDLSNELDFKVGDKVTLWGEQLPIEEIALCAKTIPYTLTCGITPRVTKVYQKSQDTE